MKTLIIVDFQYDFFNPNGALYVNGSEKVEEELSQYIKVSTDIDEVIFTVDWHAPGHCSFKTNGGEWPMHCVQFTEGAGISQKLMNSCIEKGITVKVFKKGNCEDEEEYGAFDHMRLCKDGEQYRIEVNNISNSSKQFIDNSDIEICGIALDYCVLNTAKNLLEKSSLIGGISVTLLGKFCPCIGNRQEALDAIKGYGAIIK